MKNEYTIDEMRLELAKAIQDKIDAYSQKLVELRNRELAKAEEVKEAKGSHDNCPLCGKEDAPHACICLHKADWKKSAAKSEEVEKCGDMDVAKAAAPEAKSDEVEKCGEMKAEKNEEIVPTVKSAKKNADVAAKVKKGELMIDRKKENTPGKRLKDVPEGSDKGVLPSDEKSKVVEAEGSGGEITKAKAVKKSEEELEKALPGRKVLGALGAAAALATGAAAPKAMNADMTGGYADKVAARVAEKRPKLTIPGKKKAIVADPVEVKGSIGKAEVPAAKPPTAAPTGANPPAASNTSKPKNAAPKSMAAPKPPPAPGAPAMKAEEPAQGKASGTDEIKKSELGNCLLCGKNEHAGNC